VQNRHDGGGVDAGREISGILAPRPHDMRLFHAVSTSASLARERYFHSTSPPSCGEHSVNHRRDSSIVASRGRSPRPARFAFDESTPRNGLCSGLGDPGEPALSAVEGADPPDVSPVRKAGTIIQQGRLSRKCFSTESRWAVGPPKGMKTNNCLMEEQYSRSSGL
jgi:hypothetical protein